MIGEETRCARRLDQVDSKSMQSSVQSFVLHHHNTNIEKEQPIWILFYEHKNWKRAVRTFKGLSTNKLPFSHCTSCPQWCRYFGFKKIHSSSWSQKPSVKVGAHFNFIHFDDLKKCRTVDQKAPAIPLSLHEAAEPVLTTFSCLEELVLRRVAVTVADDVQPLCLL